MTMFEETSSAPAAGRKPKTDCDAVLSSELASTGVKFMAGKKQRYSKILGHESMICHRNSCTFVRFGGDETAQIWRTPKASLQSLAVRGRSNNTKLLLFQNIHFIKRFTAAIGFILGRKKKEYSS